MRIINSSVVCNKKYDAIKFHDVPYIASSIDAPTVHVDSTLTNGAAGRLNYKASSHQATCSERVKNGVVYSTAVVLPVFTEVRFYILPASSQSFNAVLGSLGYISHYSIVRIGSPRRGYVCLLSLIVSRNRT